MPSIVFKDVDYAYVDNNETYVALEGIDLEISDGEFVCLVGHSGCGKTSLLRIIAGIDAPDEGQLIMGGRTLVGPSVFVEPEKRNIGVVFQDYALFPHLTVRENVMFGLRKLHKDKALARRVIREAREKNPASLELAWTEARMVYDGGKGDVDEAERLFESAKAIGQRLCDGRLSELSENDARIYGYVLAYLSKIREKEERKSK